MREIHTSGSNWELNKGTEVWKENAQLGLFLIPPEHHSEPAP